VQPALRGAGRAEELEARGPVVRQPIRSRPAERRGPVSPASTPFEPDELVLLEEVGLVFPPDDEEDSEPLELPGSSGVTPSPTSKSPSRPAMALQAARPSTIHPSAAPRRI
jgi:hypothetical protein